MTGPDGSLELKARLTVTLGWWIVKWDRHTKAVGIPDLDWTPPPPPTRSPRLPSRSTGVLCATASAVTLASIFHPDLLPGLCVRLCWVLWRHMAQPWDLAKFWSLLMMDCGHPSGWHHSWISPLKYTPFKKFEVYYLLHKNSSSSCHLRQRVCERTVAGNSILKEMKN